MSKTSAAVRLAAATWTWAFFLPACSSDPVVKTDVQPAISSYALPGGSPGEHDEVRLSDGDRPVLVDVWTPPAAQSPRGLVLVSHGSQSKGSLHKFIGEHLSSRGYLVAAPNHYGDTLGTPATDTVYLDRVADLKRTLDEAEARADWKPFLDAGVASTGHSIGGFDALALCGAAIDAAAVSAECDGGNDTYCRLLQEKDRWRSYADARVKTCVGMTPFVHPIYGAGGEGGKGLDKPVLLFGAKLDPVLLLEPYLRTFFGQAPNDTLMLELEGVGHLDFTDLLHDGTLAHAEIKTIVNAYMTAWLEARLHGDTRAAALFTEEAIESGAYGYAVNIAP